MGPLADSAFIRVLHQATEAKRDCDYIPIIYDGNCIRPDRSAFLTFQNRYSPEKSLKSSLRFLEKCGASVIAMPCNTAHFWFKKLQKNASGGTVLLNMPLAAANACRSKGFKKVLLLATEGTYRKEIYSIPLAEMGIECITPPPSIKDDIYSVIQSIKAGRSTDMEEITDKVCSLCCDAIITGCTELSYYLLNSPQKLAPIFVDSLSALACEAVCACNKSLRYVPYT